MSSRLCNHAGAGKRSEPEAQNQDQNHQCWLHKKAAKAPANVRHNICRYWNLLDDQQLDAMHPTFTSMLGPSQNFTDQSDKSNPEEHCGSTNYPVGCYSEDDTVKLIEQIEKVRSLNSDKWNWLAREITARSQISTIPECYELQPRNDPPEQAHLWVSRDRCYAC